MQTNFSTADGTIVKTDKGLLLLDLNADILRHSYFYASDRKTINKNRWLTENIKKEFFWYYAILYTIGFNLEGVKRLELRRSAEDWLYTDEQVRDAIIEMFDGDFVHTITSRNSLVTYIKNYPLHTLKGRFKEKAEQWQPTLSSSQLEKTLIEMMYCSCKEKFKGDFDKTIMGEMYKKWVSIPITSISDEDIEAMALRECKEETKMDGILWRNGYHKGYKANTQRGGMRNLLNEIQRRQLLIKSEPDGIVRETMINNLLLDLDENHTPTPTEITLDEELKLVTVKF